VKGKKLAFSFQAGGATATDTAKLRVVRAPRR